MKTKLHNFFLNRRLFIVFLLTAVICGLFPVILLAETETPTEPEYVYLDLSAASIVIDGNHYTGARYDGASTATSVDGYLDNSKQAYYIYQSNGDINTGIINGEFKRPSYTNTRVYATDGTQWDEFITDHPNGITSGDATDPNNGSASVDAVIKEWISATTGTGRQPTENNITFKGNFGEIVVVLDNIWSRYQKVSQDRNTGSIGYHTYGSTDMTKNEITLQLRGDNRVANIFYSTNAPNANYQDFVETNKRLIFDCYKDETTSTLTVANNTAGSGGQWWNAAIGSADSYDACYGLIFNGGVIYAGTTAADDCTAIGGGGNGAATIIIDGATITAVSSTSGSAIGGGIGKSAQGGCANITINSGNVYAYNFGYGKDYTNKTYSYIVSSAIGGGSSSGAPGCEYANVTINGGKVYAQSVGGTAIGGGSSTTKYGGHSNVTITGGTVIAKSIAGKLYDNSQQKSVDIAEGAAIGGGTGATNGGTARLEVREADKEQNPTVLQAGSIGGGQGGISIGKANVYIYGGSVQGQVIMEGDGSTFEMTGGTLDNSTKTNDFVFLQENGGAVHMKASNGVSTVSGGTIQNCSGINGGAVYMTAGTFTLSGDGAITNCRATENGGAVYLGGGNMIITGGSLTKNNAQNGGAAYVNASNTTHGVTVTGGNITENTATENGGGIYVNNGFYKMTGGSVDGNHATAGNGGGVYVSSENADAIVDVLSGSISNNTAGTSGGAVAVVGQKGSTGNIVVTVGVNKAHFNEDGTPKDCDHDEATDRDSFTCPVINNNKAQNTGGAVYISGGSLNLFCLEETGSQAADGNSKSNFMMVEGGNVTLSTADKTNTNPNSAHGKIIINSSIHVYAGNMIIEGSMTNPEIRSPITVDVTVDNDTQRGSFTDNRYSSDDPMDKFYKLQYFENFRDPETGIETGQYTVYQIKHGELHTILASIYEHTGYEIGGWWTNKAGDVEGSVKYEVGQPYTFDGNPGDLVLFAQWIPKGYYVYFNVGDYTEYRGEMDYVRFEYDAENTLPANNFFVPGYVFVGWDYEGRTGEYLEDEQAVTNLTTEKEITLTAVWNLCAHNSFTYSASGETLTRNCSCEKCTQTATIIVDDNLIYSESRVQPYEPQIKIYTTKTNGVEPPLWDYHTNYSGTKYSGETFSNDAPDFLIGAGIYTISISSDSSTAFATFEIKKADREAPAKPEYEAVDGYIQIKDTGNLDKNLLQYKIIWYNANSEQLTDTIPIFENAVSPGFVLKTNYTNYYVYASHKGDDNYNESIWVRADSILFYEGNVYIHIKCEDGITHTTETYTSSRGLKIKVWPSDDDHYLYDTKVEISDENIHGLTINGSQPIFDIGNIPPSPGTGEINIYLDITGVKKKVVITPAITESEVFGNVRGSAASITNDSAYTVYYEIKNYDDVYTDPKLVFSKTLPEKTTLILIDKTNIVPVYYYETITAETNTILLEKFTKMGTTTDLVVPTDLNVPLKYQVIVDFSDVENGLISGNLQTQITADLLDENSAKGAPPFPVDISLVETSFTNYAAPGITISMNESLQQAFTIADARLTNNVDFSKWNNRRGSLVLTPTAPIPEDARIEVRDQSTGNKTTYNLQSNGTFIVPLKESDSSQLLITLISNMFPKELTTYSFKVEVISSDSTAGVSPINGIILYPDTLLSFTKPEDSPELSLSISGDKKVYSLSEDPNVTVNVNWSNLPADANPILKLLHKQVSEDNSNEIYVDTGWTSREIADQGNQTVPLMKEQRLTGSFCVILQLSDIDGKVIASIPYYFVVSE